MFVFPWDCLQKPLMSSGRNQSYFKDNFRKEISKFNDSIIGNTESLPSERMCSLSWLSFDESNWQILSPNFQQVNPMLGK